MTVPMPAPVPTNDALYRGSITEIYECYLKHRMQRKERINQTIRDTENYYIWSIFRVITVNQFRLNTLQQCFPIH